MSICLFHVKKPPRKAIGMNILHMEHQLRIKCFGKIFLYFLVYLRNRDESLSLFIFQFKDFIFFFLG